MTFMVVRKTTVYLMQKWKALVFQTFKIKCSKQDLKRGITHILKKKSVPIINMVIRFNKLFLIFLHFVMFYKIHGRRWHSTAAIPLSFTPKLWTSINNDVYVHVYEDIQFFRGFLLFEHLLIWIADFYLFKVIYRSSYILFDELDFGFMR